MLYANERGTHRGTPLFDKNTLQWNIYRIIALTAVINIPSSIHCTCLARLHSSMDVYLAYKKSSLTPTVHTPSLDNLDSIFPGRPYS